MTSQPKEEKNHYADDAPQDGTSAGVGWTQKIIDQFNKTKAHAETYPYVWGSYIVVYGTLGLWFTYRWRKLRKTEDNVRVLHERLCKLVEADKSNGSCSGVAADKAVNSNLSTSDK